ncbi:MAG: hypothetical protein OEY29_08940 [Gammaproteobacteria bacterium]|nr:hypothetical protein [Gammaproteobacteria bacterium]
MTNTSKTKRKFNVESIEEVSTPEGMSGDNWHRYIIGEGNSKIEGLRPGSLKNVTAHAQEYCDELNDRISRGGSTYSPRAKQK